MEQNTSQPKARGIALLPILVFLVLYLGAGIWYEYIAPIEGKMGFYVMSVVVAFGVALIVAFLQNRKRQFIGNIQLCAKSTGEAMGSEIAVVEGKNSITLNNARLTGHIKHGIMLYQSFSGDAGIGEAKFTAKNSLLTNKSDGPMFYITNTTATANLESTQLIQDGDVLIQAASDRWGNEGKNGGTFTMNAINQELKGKILGNNISQITLNLQGGSHWTGSFNEDYAADKAALNLAKDAVWDVTANSYLTTFSDADSTFSNINSNGHKIYYDKKENPALGGKTYKLPGGGKLIAK